MSREQDLKVTAALGLIETLKAADSSARNDLLAHLNNFETSSLTLALVKFIQDNFLNNDYEITPSIQKSIDLIVSFGKVSVSPLILVLKNNEIDWTVREATAIALGQIGDPGTVSDLINSIKDNKNNSWSIREAATIALGKIKTKESEEGLRMALQDPNKDVKKAALKSLEKHGIINKINKNQTKSALTTIQ